MVHSNVGAGKDSTSLYCEECGTRVVSQGGEFSAASITEFIDLDDTFDGVSVPSKNMLWADFLGRFAFWLAGIGNLVNAYRTITGMQYGENKKYVYQVFSTVKSIDFISGSLFAILGGICMFTAFSIMMRRRAAVRLAPICGIYAAILSFFYAATLTLATNTNCFDTVSTISIAGSLVMGLINLQYFANREDIFVN